MYAKDEDVAKMLGPDELLTFQRWTANKGSKGGKGNSRWQKGGQGNFNGG